VLNSAFTRAGRWRWIGTNPVRQAEAPRQRPNPNPPSPTQAARIVEEARRDPDWGMFVWLAMTTGARRGDLCVLRWDRVDFAPEVLGILGSAGVSAVSRGRRAVVAEPDQ
jgi:integrase